jgi:hypothetical protein
MPSTNPERIETGVPGQERQDMLILPSSSHFLLLLQVDQQAQLDHQLFSETGQFLSGKEQNMFIFSASALPLSTALLKQ